MIPDWFSFIDAAFGLAVVLFAWGGFQKGFAAQVAYILTFLIMGGLLLFAYPYVYTYFGKVFRSLDQTFIMWFLMAGLVVLAVFIFILFNRMMAKQLKKQLSERSDHAAGLLLGTVRGILAALLSMIFLVMLGPQRIEQQFCERSYTGRFVSKELVMRIRPRLSRPLVEEKTREWRNWLLGQEEAGDLEK